MKFDYRLVMVFLVLTVLLGMVSFRMTATLLQRHQQRNVQVFRDELLKAGIEHVRTHAEVFFLRLEQLIDEATTPVELERALHAHAPPGATVLLLERGQTSMDETKALLNADILEHYFRNAEMDHLLSFSRNNFREFFEDTSYATPPRIMYYRLYRPWGEWFMVGYGAADKSLTARLRFIDERNQRTLGRLLLLTYGAPAAGGVLLLALYAALLNWMTRRPLRNMRHALQALASRYRGRRPRNQRPDDIEDIEGTVDHIVARLEKELEARRQNEQALSQCNRDLEQELAHAANDQRMVVAAAQTAESAKHRFLTNTSHELRTPLNAMLGFAELLGKTPLNEEQRQFVAMIEKSGGILLDLILNILDAARFQEHHAGVVETEFDLIELLERVVETMGSGVSKPGVELLLHHSLRMPRVFKGDPVRLTQVLVYTLGNALTFTKQGSVRLRVGPVFRGESPVRGCEWLAFVVRDTGVGIAADRRKHLFDTPPPLQEQGRRKTDPTGYGLALTRQLVGTMHGTIELHSREGHGTTVRICLPLAPMPSPDDPPTVPPLLAPDRRLALVDGHLALHRMVGRWCCLCGLEPPRSARQTAFENREQILRSRMHDSKCPVPDILLISPQLPDGSGVELMARLRRMPGWETVRYVGLCASVDVAEEEQAAGVHFDAYCPKPLHMRRFIHLVNETSPEPQTGTSASTPPRQRGSSHVLVAEDNVPSQMLIRTLLEQLGCSSDIVDNGLEAFERTKTRGYDLIFMDLMMPKMGGIEAARLIRKHARQHIPIVAMTAASGDRVKELEDSEAVDDIMVKPINRRNIERMLVKWLAPRS